MSGSSGRLTLSELQSSSFYSESVSRQIQDSTHRDEARSRGRLRPSVLLRVLWRVTKVFLWLVLLAHLRSVPLWFGILATYLLLSFLVSRLRGGTLFSLALTGSALLLRSLLYATRVGAGYSLRFASFMRKQDWSFSFPTFRRGLSYLSQSYIPRTIRRDWTNGRKGEFSHFWRGC